MIRLESPMKCVAPFEGIDRRHFHDTEIELEPDVLEGGTQMKEWQLSCLAALQRSKSYGAKR